MENCHFSNMLTIICFSPISTEQWYLENYCWIHLATYLPNVYNSIKEEMQVTESLGGIYMYLTQEKISMTKLKLPAPTSSINYAHRYSSDI